MKTLKYLPFVLFSLFSFLWFLSFYFCFNPIFFTFGQWAKLNFVLSFFFGGSLLFLIFSFSEIKSKIFKIILFCWFVLASISLFSFYIRPSSLSPSVTLILSFFLIFSLWLFLLLICYVLKILENTKIFYSLILVGVFILLNGLLYFFLPKNLLQKEHLLLGPISSILLIFFEGLLILAPVLETRFFLNGILMIAILEILFFLMFSSTQLHFRVLMGTLIFLFLIFSLFFMEMLFGESKRRKEMERILREERELAEAKDQFILSIQHHLRTPLGPVRGYLENIIQGVYGREENPVIREKLVEIKKLIDNLYSLLESLLDLQEIKLKKEKLKLEECQIENLIESVVEELLPFAKEKGLYLKYEKTKLPSIKVDRKRIREAIWNLVDNAIRYTRKGGVTISTKLEGEKIKIEVSDTGIGMEKEEIERFLEGKIFERGKEAKKMYGPGRGIGLALAIEFIKAHGGKISAKSEGFGRGTTFWIELPILK